MSSPKIASIRSLLLLIALLSLAACQSSVGPREQAAGAAPPEPIVTSPGECAPGETDWVWSAPRSPRAGEPLRVIAGSAVGALDGLFLTDPAGMRSAIPARARGGPPWSLVGRVAAPGPGRHRLEAARDGRVVACAEIDTANPGSGHGEPRSDLAHRALYSIWIEHLFDAPAEQSLSFPSLAPVLRDPGRNLLYGFLGANEDASLPAEPDCADLPYFLDAYFAWKMGLPVAYRSCSRGSRNAPPACGQPTIETVLAGGGASSGAFNALGRRIMNGVHSGCGRTALRDDATDFYPVPLTRSALWPGTVYADPYGHTLILVKWVPQQGERGGILLAVDAQPDNSVNRKRFWEGTFLFAQTPSAGAGFKAKRPLAPSGGGLRPLSNRELIAATPPYSDEQAGLDAGAFYARMQRLINPQGLDPESAYASTLDALMEQLESRVKSVDRGEAYMREHPSPPMSMPEGPAIFETIGPWEDFATPSRDMRLLIAMKVLEGLPERIRRYPELYRLGGRPAASTADAIEQLHARRSQERFVSYTRSDTSTWRISLAEIYRRRDGLEVGYNPNDCIERRWGATPGSDEYATCRRQAPSAQRQRMQRYRPWFAETRRPPR